MTIDGLAGLRDHTGDESPDPTLSAWHVVGTAAGAGVPRGVEAIRIVLEETGQRLDTREITEELTRRGWRPNSSNPENATSTNAARAADVIPEIVRERTEGGHYLYWYQPRSTTPPRSDDRMTIEEAIANQG